MLLRLQALALLSIIQLSFASPVVGAEGNWRSLEATANRGLSSGDAKSVQRFKDAVSAAKASKVSDATIMKLSIELAEAMKYNQQYDEALELLREQLKSWDEKKLPRTMTYESCLDALCRTLSDCKKYDQVSDVARQMISVCTTCGKTNSLSMSDAYEELGWASLCRDQYEQAKSYAETSIAIAEKQHTIRRLYGLDRKYMHLAEAEAHLKQIDQAYSHCSKAIEIVESIYFPTSYWVGIDFYNAIRILKDADAEQMASQFENRNKAINDSWSYYSNGIDPEGKNVGKYYKFFNHLQENLIRRW